MSITSKAKLVEFIYKWLIRDQINDNFMNLELVETYIQLTESEFNRELKITDLEDTLAYTLSTTDNFITLPVEYRGIQNFEFDSRPFEITFYPTRQAMKEKCPADTARPSGYIIIGNKIIFNCIPDQAYTMTLDFFAAVEPLTTDSSTNIILQKFPDAYLYGGIRQALLNLNITTRLQDVAAIYKDIIDRIKEDDKNSRFPVAGRMKPYTSIGG